MWKKLGGKKRKKRIEKLKSYKCKWDALNWRVSFETWLLFLQNEPKTKRVRYFHSLGFPMSCYFHSEDVLCVLVNYVQSFY